MREAHMEEKIFMTDAKTRFNLFIGFNRNKQTNNNNKAGRTIA